MASSKGAAPPRPRKSAAKAPKAAGKPRALPRPLPLYRSGDPSLDAVLLPLLARAEPGSERAVDLERARSRLLAAPQPSDAPHLAALLNDDALDLGSAGPRQAPRSPEERQQRAAFDRQRAARLDYLGLLMAAACLHEQGQARLAAVLRSAHDHAVKERAALVAATSPAPLTGALEEALRHALDAASPEPSAEERNLLSSASRALLRHLPADRALAALRPYLEEPALGRPGGVARAQMILTDLDIERLDPGFRAVLGALLRHPQLSSFAGDVFTSLPPSASDAALAAAVLDEQIARGDPPDGYLVWLLARSPHPAAGPTLLRLLGAEHDPDWQTILDGLQRLDDPTSAEPLLRWIEGHKKLTGRPGSWDGFEAARQLARRLGRAR